jgi:alkylation response protein AidB-like acyl-CoA dehydrogenase
MSAMTKTKETQQRASLIERVREIGPTLMACGEKADASDGFVADNYPLLKEAGLIDAAVPSELGGGGYEIRDIADMLGEVARYCASTALALSMHSHQVVTLAWRWKHQKAPVEPLLKRIAAEKIVLVTSGGADWVAGSGKAERVEGGYRITGRKIFASGSPVGDIFMTTAVLEEEGSDPQCLHFGIPMTSPNLKVVPTWQTMGMRGTASNDISIEGHVVPEAAVGLKRKAGEWHVLFHVIGMIAIPTVYGVYLGIARNARDIVVGMAKKRRPDHHLTSALGRMLVELRAAELAHDAMITAAEKGNPGHATTQEVMTGRALVARHAIAAVEAGMEAAGGASYFRRNGLERCYRDIQGARYHPMQTSQLHDYAGRLALGLPVETVY